MINFKKLKWFNLLIGVWVILQSIFIPSVMSPILFTIGILNIVIALGGIEWFINKIFKN